MRLLLFHTSSGTPFPVMETPPRLPRDQQAEGSGSGERLRWKVYRMYKKLEEKLDYQERLCSDLRRAAPLQIYHSPGLSGAQVEKEFREFLQMRYSKHRRWLWIDAMLAVVGSLLMPLPGPNIFFFYPAARTLGHYFAMKGARVTLGHTAWSLHTEPLIDRVRQNPDGPELERETIIELEERYGVSHLEARLRQLRRKS